MKNLLKSFRDCCKEMLSTASTPQTKTDSFPISLCDISNTKVRNHNSRSLYWQTQTCRCWPLRGSDLLPPNSEKIWSSFFSNFASNITWFTSCINGISPIHWPWKFVLSLNTMENLSSSLNKTLTTFPVWVPTPIRNLSFLNIIAAMRKEVKSFYQDLNLEFSTKHGQFAHSHFQKGHQKQPGQYHSAYYLANADSFKQFVFKSTDFGIEIPTETEFKEVSLSNPHYLNHALTLATVSPLTLCCPCQTSIFGRSFPRTYVTSSLNLRHNFLNFISTNPSLLQRSQGQATTTSTLKIIFSALSHLLFTFIPVPPPTLNLSSPLWGLHPINFSSNLSLSGPNSPLLRSPNIIRPNLKTLHSITDLQPTGTINHWLHKPSISYFHNVNFKSICL